MIFEKLNRLISDFKKIPTTDKIHPTFLEITGYPHYENVCSNILAFFLTPEAPHGMESLLLKSLIACNPQQGENLNLSNISVEREKVTDNGNRIDLYIETDTHLIAIENKIWHDPVNPFDDYALYMQSQNKKIEGSKKILLFLLGLNLTQSIKNSDFVFVSYVELFSEIRLRIGDYLTHSDQKYLSLLLDFMISIENLQRGYRMDKQLFNFIRKNSDEVIEIMSKVNEYKAELREKVKEVGDKTIVHASLPINKFYYRESGKLSDILVHDIEFPDGIKVAIDAILNPEGWEIQIFSRRQEHRETVKSILNEKGISINGKDRFNYKKFDFEESQDIVAKELTFLIEKIAANT